MKSLYIFNPDTDLALANNDPNFMAPKSARQLANDLSLVPIWYAEAGDSIIISSQGHEDYFTELKALFHLPVSLVYDSDLDSLDECELRPWGWNKAVVNHFLKVDNSNVRVLDMNQVEAIRRISSREWMSKILSEIKSHPYLCGKSYVLKTFSDLERVNTDLSQFLLKAPYSGSGRGLKWCRSGLDEAGSKWFNRTVNQQGLAIAEPIYRRVEDFAMEFEITKEKNITFIGFSSFRTDNNGVYQGNSFVQDEAFSTYLESTYFEPGFIESIKLQLKEILLNTYGGIYRGVLGVDMMVCRENDGANYQLHPCVEVNLRMNMGVLAHQFYQRYVSTHSRGEFGVDFYRNEGEVMAKHLDNQKKYPLAVQEGKIISGYLSLSAITSQTLCHVWVIVE